MKYQELFEIYERWRWINGFFNVVRNMKVEKKFGDKFREELDRIHRELFPRRKKIDHRNIPENIVSAVRTYWQARSVAWYTCALGRVEFINKKLDQMAQAIDLVPQEGFIILKRSSTDDYGSQGYGAAKYARASLQKYVDVLVENGFSAEIETKGSNYRDYRYQEFGVVANALPWQLDACMRKSMDVFDIAVSAWRHGINPRVLYPFLSQETSDRALKEARESK